MSIINGHARWAFDFIAWKPTLQELMVAVSLIQPEEKQRIAQFVFQEDFKSSLAGRLLLRFFVRSALCIDNRQVKFGRDERNKPYLMEINGKPNCDDKVIDCNVSHQGSFACLAGYCDNKTASNADLRLGVDVMKIEYGGGKPLHEFFRIMTRNFSDSEWNHIKSFNSNQGKLQAFMRNWCLKESYVKNIGTGITMNLQTLDFQINTPEVASDEVITDTRLKVGGKLLNNFTFEESLLNADHCVAVSLQNNPSPENDDSTTYKSTNFQLIKFEELIGNATPLTAPDEKYCVEILRKDTKHQ
jgi:phosphopantetheine--protein transferase-like protein